MNFLDRVFFDNSVYDYLVVIATIIFVLALRRLLSKFTAAVICNLFERTGRKIDKKSFIALIVRPLSWFIVIVVAVIAIDKLNFPSAWDYKIYGVTINTIIEKAGVMLIIIAFVRLVLRIIDFVAIVLKEKAGTTKAKGDDQLIVFFRDFLKVIIGVAGILLLIKSGFNKDIGTLLTGLSIVGAALALAAKESLENLIASFVIFFDKPFYVGDFLKVNNVTGRVERIGLRSTRIRTPEKTLVTVPNKQMVDSVVDNWSMRNQHRTEIRLEISIKTSNEILDAFTKGIKELLKANADILSYTVFFSEYLRNTMIITVEYISKTSSLDDLNKLRDKVNMNIKKLLDDYSVDAAAPPPDIRIEKKEEPLPPKQEPLI